MTSRLDDRRAAGTGAGGFRLPGLDGLRAIAVILVIVYHLSPGALPGGYLGVDVFFVISGFLITMLLLREREATGRISLAGFWARRARRLLPALALLLLVCGAAASALGGDTIVRLGSQLLGAVTFSSNWIFIAQGSSYFDQSAPELFRNLWSLAVEEQFYLLWPLLVLLLLLVPRAVRAVLVALGAAASLVAMALLADPADATRVYFGTDTHSFGLALGALLAVVVPLTVGTRGGADARAGWTRTRRVGAAALSLLGTASVLGLLALAVAMPQSSPWTFRGGLGLVAVLSAVAIGTMLVPRSLLARVLDLRPIRWVGARSYGLYLWHWPVFLLLGAALPGWPREGASGWALGGAALAVTVVAAALSYRFVEQPIRRRGVLPALGYAVGRCRRSAPRALAGAAAVLLLVGGGVATGLAVAADPGRGQTQAQVEAGEEALDAATPLPSAPAAPAEIDGGDILVVGDSVTLAAATQLQTDFPGIAVDAAVSRQMASAPGLVQALKDAGALRPVVVLALGTNGPIDRASIDEVRALLGARRELVLVNVQAPRAWTDQVNATLSDVARDYRNVELANWHDAVQPSLDKLNRDQVHFGPTGAAIWSGAVEDAIQRLADLPPLRDDRDYESVPRPV